MGLINQRRSVREFLKIPVEPEIIEHILRYAMRAPSAGNERPWEFWVVTDPEAKKTIASMSPYARPAERAPVVIVTCAVKSRAGLWEEGWWPQDMAACTENLLLGIVEHGLGGVWMGFYPCGDRCRALQTFLNLQEDVVPFSVVALGYPSIPVTERKAYERWEPERIHYISDCG